jgi:ABC-type sugar transport system permease subunit
MPTLILTNVWRSFPYPMLLLLAALQTVPDEMHEAARVDGANAWQGFWRITLPLIRNTLLITIIMLSLHYFNMITLPFILTGGGPVGVTDVLSLRVYREAFSFYHMGLASAVAVYIFIFNTGRWCSAASLPFSPSCGGSLPRSRIRAASSATRPNGSPIRSCWTIINS